MNTLDQAKYEYSKAHDALTHGCLQVVRECRGNTWEELYYDQSYPHNIATLTRRFEAADKHHPEVSGLRPCLDTCIILAAKIAELKSAPKVPRTLRASGTGTYSFPTTPSGIAVLEPGEYLLVAYGNGTQLVRLVRRLPSRGISINWSIQRLFYRRTSYAHYRNSTIRSNDKRILGRSHRVIQDPQPPAN